jgi:hypothetical protein
MVTLRADVLKLWKFARERGKIAFSDGLKHRPYMDNRELFVKVGARFPRPQTINIEC